MCKKYTLSEEQIVQFHKWDQEYPVKYLISSTFQDKNYWLMWDEILNATYQNSIDIITNQFFDDDERNAEAQNKFFDANIMYGALIVSIYSRIETILKHILVGLPEDKLKSIEEKKTIGHFEFKELIKAFNKINIDLKKIKCYDKMKALQKYNNAFKHQLYPELCVNELILPQKTKENRKSRTNVISQKKYISNKEKCKIFVDYTNLDIGQIVDFCNIFLKDLCDVVFEQYKIYLK